MEGTKLFNKQGAQIYPESSAECIYSEALKQGGNVEECLKDLYEKLTDISQEGEAAKNINVKIGYANLAVRTQELAETNASWGAFAIPTADAPYTWKKTSYSYDELALTTTYEIVAMYSENNEHTIYKAMNSDTEQPIIQYEKDNEGNDDYQNVDYISQDWSDIPISISAANPYAYMATRKKVDGKWTAFSTPVLYGKWAFDSKLEIKYRVTETSDVPSLFAGSVDPGEDWISNNTQVFQGYLWMITATSVNGVLQKKDDVIWSGPNLISVVQ